jgi:hypothetical protein
MGRGMGFGGILSLGIAQRDELSVLREQASDLETELNRVNRRIGEIEKDQTE